MELKIYYKVKITMLRDLKMQLMGNQIKLMANQIMLKELITNWKVIKIQHGALKIILKV